MNAPPKVKSMYDLQAEYIEFCRKTEGETLDLGNWIPAFMSHVRPLVPGELCFLMADTGIGKTAILQNIACRARDMSVILFEMELPGTLCFERFSAMSNLVDGWQVEQAYRNGEKLRIGPMDHIYVCDKAGLTIQDMRNVLEWDAKEQGGHDFKLVLVDYIGLLSVQGSRSRYERMSEAAEQLKVFAKDTDTIVVAATQIHRTGPDSEAEIHLHDAKDSGSIENSAGVLIGAYRDEYDKEKLILKVLKNTKGMAGAKIECRFNGGQMRITPWCDTDFDPAREAAELEVT